MSMIYFTGDIHGGIDELLWRLERKNIPQEKEQMVVLLGDVGVNYYLGKRDTRAKQKLQESNRTYLCVHGNHERRPESIGTYIEQPWNGGSVYVEPGFENIIFLQDGEVYDLYGAKTLVLGGAYSVDKYYRLHNGYNWFEDEQISLYKRAEILHKITEIKSVDLVLSHTCPIQWQPRDLFLPWLDQSTVDNSMERWLAEVEANLDYKYWLFGHYHDNRRINDKARMLYEDVCAIVTEDLKDWKW